MHLLGPLPSSTRAPSYGFCFTISDIRGKCLEFAARGRLARTVNGKMAASLPPVLPLYVDGAERASVAAEHIDVLDPATQNVLCKVPCTTQEEMEAIVASAVAAQKKWREVPVQQRVRCLIKFQTLLVANKDDIAECMVAENGKTKADALGDITRGIEVVEHSLSMPSLMMGETIEQISTNMDTKTIRQPLGVVAGIAPFNFPAMIPLWMLPIAVGTGNAFILKPSEKVPTASHKIVKLATEAGVTPGVISILHGGVAAVNFAVKSVCARLCECVLV